MFFFSIFFLLWWPFCSAERNNFSNFGRGSPKQLLCEIILKWDYWPRRRSHYKGFLFLALAAILFSRAEPFYYFVRGSPKEHFYEIILKSGHWPRRRCLGGMFFLFCSLERNHFSNFGSGSPKIHFCEIILKLGYWSRMRLRLNGFLFLALLAILFSGA